MLDLEQALDELYAVDPEEFVSTRKRLAIALRDAGDSDAAAELSSVRKPTSPAWVVNRLARTRRKDVDLLLDAGHRLRQAQTALLEGKGRGEFEAARTSQRVAIARLTRAAATLLAKRESTSQSVLDQVTATLDAAGISDRGRELLARGRFERPLTAGSGFEALAGLLPGGQSQAAKPEPVVDRREELQAAKDELREARRQSKELERRAERAERDATRLRDDARAAAELAQKIRREANQAAAEVTAAERRLRAFERRDS